MKIPGNKSIWHSIDEVPQVPPNSNIGYPHVECLVDFDYVEYRFGVRNYNPVEHRWDSENPADGEFDNYRNVVRWAYLSDIDKL